MDITEQDIKESVDYRSAKSTANLCMVMAIVLGSIFTTLLIVNVIINFNNSTSIVMVVILGVLLALFEAPLWCFFARSKKKCNYMLKNYQNMFYVEPIFKNPIRHYHGKNGYGYDFAVIVEHDGKNINLVTMEFRSRSDKNDCFGCEHYIGHKVACLYDPINNPHYLYVIRRVD